MSDNRKIEDAEIEGRASMTVENGHWLVSSPCKNFTYRANTDDAAFYLMDALNTRAPQAASEGKVFCQVKGHDFEDANNCVFCATDSVTISRECAESLLAALDKGVSVYMDYDAITKLFGELKQALEANPMQVTGGLCE
jgi:hypothetical protein